VTRNTYGALATTLQALGYQPIPCHGKRPLLSDWPKNVGADPRKHAGANVGILTSTTPALDVDFTDPAILALIRPLVGAAPERIGRKGALYLFRTDAPFRKLRREYVRGDESGAVEFLGEGQQFIAYGTHPDTGKPYTWTGGTGPADIRADDLPYIDEQAARDLLDQIELRLLAAGWGRKQYTIGASAMVRRSSPVEFDIPAGDYTQRQLECLKALPYIDAEDYGSWIAAGHSLKAEELSFEVFDAWSKTAPNYDRNACLQRWESFQPRSAGAYSLLRAAGLSSAMLDFTVEDAPHSTPLVLVTAAKTIAQAASRAPDPFPGFMTIAADAIARSSRMRQPGLATAAALLGMAGACSGVYSLPGGGRLNLYGCLVSRTGSGKDRPQRAAEQIASAAGAILLGQPASGEGLEDAIEPYCAALVSINEIAHMLQATNSSNAPAHLRSLHANLLKLFSDSASAMLPRARAKVKAAGVRALPVPHPSVSMIGSATPQTLGVSLSVSDIESGLVGRILFAIGDDNPELVEPEDVDISKVIHGPAEAVRIAQAGAALSAEGERSIPVSVSSELRERLFGIAKFYHEKACNEHDEMIRSILARSAEKVDRIAGVLAVWDNPASPEVTPEHVEWARLFVDWSNEGLLSFVENHMHASVEAADAASIEKHLHLGAQKASGKHKYLELLSKGLLPVAVLFDRCRKLVPEQKRFYEALRHLQSLGRIELVTEDGVKAIRFERGPDEHQTA
jgi:hypothetical protein